MLSKIRHHWSNPAINHGLLILISLIGIILPCTYLGQSALITPLLLGVIAAALAESDDNFYGRLKAQSITIVCFVLATFSIEILFDSPLLFTLGLFFSTIGFIMLGAIGPRYAKIAFGSLLIAIYTMLGASNSENIWFQPLLLVGGAIWYFIVSALWQLLSPYKPVQQNLAAVFEQLSLYLAIKRELFHPVSGMLPQPKRIEEARQNAHTVDALNECKATLLSRSNRGQVDGPTHRFLNVYFIAQDIHERISSSHYRYQDLAEQFKRSDLLFRFKYVLERQSQACAQTARALRNGQAFTHQPDAGKAIEELQGAISYLEQAGNPQWDRLLPQIKALFNNLMMIEKQLANISNPDASEEISDEALNDTDAHTPAAMWERIKSNLTPSSLLFRHAVRLSTALVAGYGIIQLLNIDPGYWILLTILFVCQPNYSATRQKLLSRIAGTVAGLVAGVILLALFPSYTAQMVFIVLSGVAFFIFRVANYGYATAFITILVLFCFNQMGQSYALILPRLADTLIGCLLSAIAVMFILPDWQSKRLHSVMAAAIEANRQYLAQIVGQYRIGKKDDLSYRIARREAHSQSANLSSAISNMLAEPGRYRSAIDESFRFLTLNQALLGYISALGAHRTRIDNSAIHQLILTSHKVIHQRLDGLAQQLNSDSTAITESTTESQALEEELEKWRDEENSSARLVLQQLHLILGMLSELDQLADHFAICKRGKSSQEASVENLSKND